MARRLIVERNKWPEEQLKEFIPLLFTQYKNANTLEIDTASTNSSTSIKYPSSIYIDKDFKTNSHKNIEIILSPFEKNDTPCFTLIEGPPGIGKSFLLKEIAFKWGNNQVLKRFKLVLLVCLRDHRLQQAQKFTELLQYFCAEDARAAEIATECSDYFLNNQGEDLLFLFDGLDELPEKIDNSLIEKILIRDVLPHCGLIVSTRPYVSAYHRKNATYLVHILGFDEAARQDYIQNAYKEQPKKVKDLTAYFSCHKIISSLCYTPFNMVVLLYIYKIRSELPKNYIELYNYFICLNICNHRAKCGHLAKCDHLENNITDITNLPDPYNEIIKQLSKLSLESVTNQKLTFTFSEIQKACPGIKNIEGAINGFGLLQAVQGYGLTGKTIIFNFVHYSVQEFLAAHYIAHLPQRDQLQVLHNINRDSNIVFVYMAIKENKGFSCRLFLSGGKSKIAISEEFLTDPLQCLRLYQCCHEIERNEICAGIEKADVFSNKKINLRRYNLTAYHVECLALFVKSSVHKEWNELCLDSSHLQDHGVSILCCINDVAITSLNLDNNGLTSSSSSNICNITDSCRVEKLQIAGNSTIGEKLDYSRLFSPPSVLKELYMQCTGLSTNAAKCLFSALK